MIGFSLPEKFDEDPERLLRKTRAFKAVLPSAPIPSKEEETVSKAPIQMAEKSLREYSVPTTDNVILGPQENIGNVGFELKTSLINMVQASPFYGLLHEDANAHLQRFLNLCSTILIKDVPQD